MIYMKKYSFDDPDYEGYVIEVPDYVIRDIIMEYMRKTYYWSTGILCLIIGFLLGVIA
jgi:hypothetical protein